MVVLVRFFLMYFALEISNRCISVKYWNLEVIERPRVTLCNHLGLMLDEILIIILKKVFIFNRVTYVNSGGRFPNIRTESAPPATAIITQYFKNQI